MNTVGQHNCGHSEDMGITCAGELPPPQVGNIRLADVTYTNGVVSGRVEYNNNGVWGTMCDDGADNDTAQVICRYLGLPWGNASIFDATGGEGDIWLDNVQCTGAENSLTECSMNGIGDHNCSHSEDVGVNCTD